jgi:multisubunit Na+/H+ antiporter MnhC subunit
MEAIVKVISVFIGLFLVFDGIYMLLTPPLGDEPIGYAIIVTGIFIPILVIGTGLKR